MTTVPFRVGSTTTVLCVSLEKANMHTPYVKRYAFSWYNLRHAYYIGKT